MGFNLAFKGLTHAFRRHLQVKCHLLHMPLLQQETESFGIACHCGWVGLWGTVGNENSSVLTEKEKRMEQDKESLLMSKIRPALLGLFYPRFVSM
jgi:hypothetical protein